MPARIAIIGAGNLGARHLQSLARLDADVVVDVVDPSQVARTRSIDLLREVGGLRRGSLNVVDDVRQIAKAPDLAIVATNSVERPQIVSALVQAGTPTMILEKVLFTNLQAYDDVETMLAEAGTKAWVNCGSRFSPRAVDLVGMLGVKPLDYKVEGAGWGLGCNVIHHLDEFALLTGCNDVALSADGLDDGIIPSKRAGYIEFTGTLKGLSADGSRFSASCEPGVFSGREVTINANGVSVKISQMRQTLTISDSKGTRTEPYPIPLQSEVTAQHVMDILAGRQPALPDYATAARLHRAMLTAFLAHLRRSAGNPAIDECPIT